MSTHTALYPGSFDPVHYGHIDIAQRAAKIFERLIVGVYDRPGKSLFFSTEVRLTLMRSVLQDLPNVEVCAYSGLTVAFAKSIQAQVLVRGLRVVSDFELEYQMALTNQQLYPELDTVCLMTRHEYAFLSSSLIKEIFMVGGDVGKMVPAIVQKALADRLSQLRS
ncbi:MAG: pantetheine-phosphate adenylyltransferase [Anaerolineae bacterium]|nr:pantetheine-phosphate adenylyltransferase [Anaerolineae bacterium]